MPRTDESDDVPGVWQELRRRRVGKVVVAYLAVAFAAVEIGIFLGPLVAAPDSIRRVVLGMMVLGFPAAVVLAWTYDITPTGVVRTPDEVGAEAPADTTTNTWLVPTILGLSAGAILHLLHM